MDCRQTSLAWGPDCAARGRVGPSPTSVSVSMCKEQEDDSYGAVCDQRRKWSPSGRFFVVVCGLTNLGGQLEMKGGIAAGNSSLRVPLIYMVVSGEGVQSNFGGHHGVGGLR